MFISQAKTIVEAAINFNLNNIGGSNSSYITPMLWSMPGIGKSTLLTDIIESLELEEVQVIVAQFDSAELGGFPMVDTATKTYFRARPFFMPTEGKGVIVCDELPQAPTAVQNIIAQLVNERRIGEHRLPEGWTVVAAGNPMSAKAGTAKMPSHLKDRLLHLDIEVSHEDFRGYALTKDFRPEITSYINERPEWLSKFDPNSNACPSPRSWERANTIINLGLDPVSERLALKGQLGEGAVTDFTGYLKVWRDLPSMEAIVSDPKGTPIPTDPSVLYALCSSIAHKAKDSNMKEILTYIRRFENLEFTVFCVKDTLTRFPELKKNKLVQQWILTDGKSLML